MSQYQPKGDRNEVHQRRIGRSSGSSAHQRASGGASTVKGGGSGGPSPSASAPPLSHNPSAAAQSTLGPSAVSSGRSVKRSNGATGHSTRGASPSAGLEFSDNQRVQRSSSPQPHLMAQQAQPQPGAYPSKQPPIVNPSSNGTVPRSVRPGTPTSSSSSGSAAPMSAIAKTGTIEVSQSTVQPAHSFQFGSISPSFMQSTGVQIPVRTSSCPPILDDLKRDQAKFEAASATGGKVVSIPLGGKQILPSQAQYEQGSATVNKIAPVSSGEQGTTIRQASSSAVAGTFSARLPQSQGHHSLSLQYAQTSPHVQAAQAAVTSQAHLQMQPQYAAAQSQQQGLVQLPLTQTLQSQLVIQNAGQGMKFPQSMAGPPLGGQIMRPPLNSLTGQLSAQQIAQTSHQMGGPLSGTLTNQISSGLPGVQYGLPVTNNIFQRASSAVKIVHPETHEELRFDSKSMKGDAFNDNNLPAGIASSTGRLVGNGPLHTRPSMGYVGRPPHTHMNYYSPHQNGAFTPYYPASIPAKPGTSASISAQASTRSSFGQPSQGQGISVQAPSPQGQGGSALNQVPSVATPSVISAAPADLGAEPFGTSTATVAEKDHGDPCEINQPPPKVDAQPLERIEDKGLKVRKLDDSPASPSGNVTLVPEHANEVESFTVAPMKDGSQTEPPIVVPLDVKQGSKKKKKKESSAKLDAVNVGDSGKVHTTLESKKQAESKISGSCAVEASAAPEASDAILTVLKANDETELNAVNATEEKISEAAPGSTSLTSDLVLAETLVVDSTGTSVQETGSDKVVVDVANADVAASPANKLDNELGHFSEPAAPLVTADASCSYWNNEESESSISKANIVDTLVETSKEQELTKEEEKGDHRATQSNLESVCPVSGNIGHTGGLDKEFQGTASLGTADAGDSSSAMGLLSGRDELTSKPHEGIDLIGNGNHLDELIDAQGDSSFVPATDSSSPAMDSTKPFSFPPDGAIILDGIAQVQSNAALEPTNMFKAESSAAVLGKDSQPVEDSCFIAPDVKHNRGKKKLKGILAKADAAGNTADLYNAYKAPEEKKPDDVKVVETVEPKILSTDSVKQVAMPEDKVVPKELDDWEDAAELPSPNVTTGLAASMAGDSLRTNGTLTLESAGREKYTRDFLLTFRDQIRELPSDFEIRADIAELLMNPQAVFSPSERDTMSGSGRLLDRQLSGGSRRGNTASNFDDERWIRQHINQAGHGEMGPGSFRSGNNQGLIPRISANVRSGLPMPPAGKLPISPVTPISSGPARSSSTDADRWQRMPVGPKGPIAPLQSPLPAMHKAEKRYEAGPVSDEEQRKQRQMKAILNKLTPQNFDKLFIQVKDVNIASAATLTGVISQIFDKALLEPTFCEMYAKFCVQLAVDLPEYTEDGDKVTFKRVLLNKCQEEFQRGEREQAEVDNMEEDGEAKLSLEEREEKRVKAKRRMLGNIRFIGELYKKSMLTERIMHECIQKLLGEFDNPEEDVEALCKLMSTIGRMIDHPRAKDHMDSYFDRMTKLSNDQKLPARLKFMLKDVIDLRRNGWQERRKVEGPKKIEEVHRDAVQERQATGTQAGRLSRGSSVGPLAGRRVAPPSDLSVRGSVSPLYSPSTPIGNLTSIGIRGGQSQMGIRSSYGQDVRNEDRLLLDNRSLPMPLSQRSAEDGPITLGPQGGLGKGMAVRGQVLGSTRSALLDASPATNLSDSRRFGSGGLPPYNSGMVQDRISSFGARDEVSQRGPERPLTSFEGPLLERPVTLDRYVPASSSRDSRSLERTLSDRSISLSMISTTTQQQGLSTRPSTAPAVLPLSEEQLREKSEHALIEYFSAQDLKEAGRCVEDLRAPKYHSTLVFLWFSISLEKKVAERDLLVKLLSSLFKTDPALLKQDQIVKGIEMVLEPLEDLIVDVPRAPEYLAVMIGKLIAAGVISLIEVGKLLKADYVLQNGYALDMLGRILEGLQQEIGETGMLNMYKSSEINLEEFIVSNDRQRNRLDALLQERNLQCLYSISITKG